MSDITHDEASAELAGVALGSVPANLAERVRVHARTCAECRAELGDFEAVVRELGQLIPQYPINPGRAAGIRSRLISRASADTDRRAVTVASSAAARVKPPASAKPGNVASSKVREAPPERTAREKNSQIWPAVALIALIITAGSVIQMLRANSEARSLRATIQVQQQDTVENEGNAAAATTADRDSIVAAVTGADVKIIPLTHYGARGAIARMFWNRETNVWTLVTYSIRQPKPDKVFQVWLSTANGTQSAGTFLPDATGRALLQSSSAVSRNGLYSVMITEEAKGGAPAPTGPAVIAGAP